jgi:serine/threonine-protein kinase
VLLLRHRLGKLSDAELDSAREALKHEMAAQFPPSRKAYADFVTWALFDARDARGKAAAEAALARMPPEPPHFFESFDLFVPALMQQAGRPAEALPRLKAWCSACTVMGFIDEAPLDDTLLYMHGQLVLGAALEATGDTQGACAAYAVVRRRWKNATPRSLTLEKANARSDALHCP